MTNDDELRLKIVEAMGRTDEKLIALIDVVHEVKDNISSVKEEQINIKEHNDKVVHELQKHFDHKIAKCNEDVMDALKESHLDKTEVRDAITKAIKASEKRTFARLSLFGVVIGSVIAFIYEYSEPIINIINMLRGK